MDEDLRAGLGEGEGAGAADAARGAGDEGGLSRERGHGPSSFILRDQPAVLPPSTGHDLAGHERGLVGGEEDDGLRDLLRRADAAERDAASTSAALRSGVPVKRLSMPVSVGPGATALTRTPNGAASSAADFVDAFHRVLAGGVDRGARAPRSPIVEEMLTMLPLPCACMTRSSCFMLSSVPSTLVSNVAA